MGFTRTATPRDVPAVGMRGGLGRTLLTALLVLAILPLGVVSWYASTRNRLNIQAEITEKLASIAALKEAQISRWIDDRQAVLASLSSGEEVSPAVQAAAADDEATATSALTALCETYDLADLALLTASGEVVASSDPTRVREALHITTHPGETELIFTAPDAENEEHRLAFIQPLRGEPEEGIAYLAAWSEMEHLNSILEQTAGLGETGMSYLITQDDVALPQGHIVGNVPTVIASQEEGEDSLYENYAGVPVIGVSTRLPSLNATLVVEQAQEEAFIGNDTVAAAVITATLIAALAAAVIAAFVTRQITRPLVQLTESTLRLASGDLSERVEITSRDEIGILAYVFNQMAAELETLYNNLEEKVAQRTQLLQQANYQIQRRAIQMQASVEVGQAITSILEPNRLLNEVVHLVRTRFIYSYTAIYTVDRQNGHLTLRASAGTPDPVRRETIRADAENPVGRAFKEGTPVVETYQQPAPVGPPTDYTRVEVIIPLQMGEDTTGVLAVQSTEPEDFDSDDVSVLQNVAYQVAIALENARAYAVERKAVQRLREMNQFKRQFLANMSHEFRTPLTNILGFSRLMLKGLEGPLSEQQRQDLEIIHYNGEHLLGLINDLLDVSQIEAGLVELQLKEVNLEDLIHSVMATTSAMVRDKEIALEEVVPPDLPTVPADPTRIRQVLLRLLTNAAQFTQEGKITISARAAEDNVEVSVSDTGVGIRPADIERIFRQFEKGTLKNGHRAGGAGLGLALSKEFIEMHGGEIWVESEIGEGSTFTFSLPLHPVTGEDL